MRDEKIEIEIRNFHKYNPRKDLKSMNWFRLQSNLFDDADYYPLCASAKLAWVYLLRCCALRMSPACRVSVPHMSAACSLRAIQCRRAISKLEQLQWLKVISRNEHVPAHNERTRRTNITNKTKRVDSRQPELSAPPKDSSPRSHWLAELWNDQCKKLPKIRIPISQSRLKKIQVRVKEIGDKGIWIEAIGKVSDSRFCNGINERSWVASFDWFIRPDTVEKILEGKYDNRKALNKADMRVVNSHDQWERIQRGEI